MSPPTEQLIRDYLNRLSVAARDRMSPDERRALVERTRKLIERRSDFAGRPTTLEVGKVLARLGDPAAVVERELRRLPAVRGSAPVRAAEAGEAAESGSRGFLARVLRRDQGRAEQTGWPAGWRRSADPQVPGDAGLTLFDSAAGADAGAQAMAATDDRAGDVTPGPAEPADTDGGDVSPVPSAPAAGPFLGRPQQAHANGVPNGAHGEASRPADAAPAKPQWPAAVARDGSHDYGRDQDSDDGLPVLNGRAVGGRAEPPENGTDSHTAGEPADWQLETPATPVLRTATRRVVTQVASWARARPLEAAAVVLLGLGGVIYPPVFLLGAIVAVGSRLWDYRDKWIGLVLPVVLTVIGLAVGIAAGGRHNGLHEGWVYLNITSRIAALLGAGYLAWRSARGRRQPLVPPWNKPHRVG